MVKRKRQQPAPVKAIRTEAQRVADEEEQMAEFVTLSMLKDYPFEAEGQLSRDVMEAIEWTASRTAQQARLVYVLFPCVAFKTKVCRSTRSVRP